MWRTERIIAALIVLGLIVLAFYVRAGAGTLEDAADAWNKNQIAQLIAQGRIVEPRYEPPRGETDEFKWDRWLREICFQDHACPEYGKQFGYY